MSDTLPTGEEPQEELDVPPAEALATELGLDLSDDERAQAEEMVARLQSQFGLESSVVEEPEDEPEPEPSEPAEPEPEPEEPEAPEPVAEAADEWISIDGRAVPVAEARSMLELRQYLARNPEKAEAVRRAVEGEPEPEPPAEPQPPEWMDLDDPSQRFMWETLKTQSSQIAQLQQQQSAQLAETARGRAVSEVNVAMDTFRRNHPELTEDDIQTVRTHAVGLNIIGGLSAGRNGTDAVLKALDIAYLDLPDFRARAKGEPTPTEQRAKASADRKQKLSGLAGGSGSAPKQPAATPRPTSDREMRLQATQWLSEQGIS